MLNFKGKTALITGASSGIGEAIAYELAFQGANLLLISSNEQKLQKVANNLEKFDIDITYKATDLSNFNSIDNLVEFINTNNIKPSLLVLNAGVSQRSKTLETDFEVDQKLMNINYFGHVYLIKKMKEHLLSENQISIAVNTSISGVFGFPLRSAYAASKRALFGFFESLDLEYDNINVTFLIPGRINTEISKSALLGDGKPYAKMDDGQATGMDVTKCAKIAVKAIRKKKKKKLIGGKELLMVHFYKFIPPLFYKLAKKVSAT